MSAPRSRRLRNQTAPVTVAKRDRAIAVGGSLAMVALTALLIWMMRPGRAFVPGTGGLITRQPRAAWLVVAVLVAIGLSYWLVKRPTAKWKRPMLVAGICVAVIVILAPLVATQWGESGILRHYTTQPTFAPLPTDDVPTTTTVQGGSTTTKAGAPTTSGPSTTSASSTSSAPTTTAGPTTTLAPTSSS